MGNEVEVLAGGEITPAQWFEIYGERLDDGFQRLCLAANWLMTFVSGVTSLSLHRRMPTLGSHRCVGRPDRLKRLDIRSKPTLATNARESVGPMERDLLNQLDTKVQVLLQRLRDEKQQLMKRLANRELHFGEASARLRECEELRDRITERIKDILARRESLNLG